MPSICHIQYTIRITYEILAHGQFVSLVHHSHELHLVIIQNYLILFAWYSICIPRVQYSKTVYFFSIPIPINVCNVKLSLINKRKIGTKLSLNNTAGAYFKILYLSNMEKLANFYLITQHIDIIHTTKIVLTFRFCTELCSLEKIVWNRD